MHNLFCINITPWKKKYIQFFLDRYYNNKFSLKFLSDYKQAEIKGFNSQSQLVTWASKNQTEAIKIINPHLWF